MSSLNIPCDEGVLADLTALSNQVNSPIPPFPVFFSTGSCGGGGGVAIGSNFPLFYFPVNCPATGVPTPSDNCLRVIDNSDGHISADYDQTIPANQVNVLPDPSDNENNIFTDPNERLYSWYVPHGYRMVFFHDDIRQVTIKSAYATQDYLEVSPNQVVADACLQFQALVSGKTFFTYGIYNPGTDTDVPCPLSVCACGGPEPVPCPTGPPVKPVACPGVSHYARYFLVLKERDFSDLLLDICMKNRRVTYGDDPTNSLNLVWKPQSPACDSYITSLCQQTQYASTDMCACFVQQQALNVQYGPTLQVPVCCFGQSSCYNNLNAYKTADMLQNCCDFAQCETLVENNPSMQVKASPAGVIECVGKFVQFPIPPVTPVAPQTTVFFDSSDSIPFYTWIVFAIAIVLLVVFIFVLLFV